MTVQARKTFVALVGPKRTFARIRAATRMRVDAGLRMPGAEPDGRLLAAKGLGDEMALSSSAPTPATPPRSCAPCSS